MFWNLVLVSFFGTCAFAMYYQPSESEEQAYEMEKLLDINNFLTIQDEMAKITAALSENNGLEPQADRAEQKLDELSPKIDYLVQITKDLASPCREGIYRDGKCVNYVRKDKFVGDVEEELENLCHAHFGEFFEENIIDYSDGPYGGHNGHDSDGHGGGSYGDAANEGGNYGDTSFYGGVGSYGDAPPPEGGYFSEETHTDGFFGDHASPPLPNPDTGDDEDDEVPLPPPVTYYVCYEPPVVKVPKNIYFPTEENEEEEGEELPPSPPGGGNPFPLPGSDIWFSGKFNPEGDEDECSLFAHHGKVIDKNCITVYDEPKDWQDAQDSCKARGGSLWEPSHTIAGSTVAYAKLKEKFGHTVAEIESDADPSGSHILLAKIWTGFKQKPTVSTYESQISSNLFSYDDAIFAGSGSGSGFAAAMVQPGISWEGLDPDTKLPWACQFHLVKK